MIIGISVAAGVIALVLLFRPIFGDLSGFIECLRFWLTPDIISAFRGEYFDDIYSELRLFLWPLGGVAIGFAVYGLLSWVFA